MQTAVLEKSPEPEVSGNGFSLLRGEEGRPSLAPFSIVENLGVNPDSGGLPPRRGSGAQVVRTEVGSGKGAGPIPAAASVFPDVPLAASSKHGDPFPWASIWGERTFRPTGKA